MRIRLDERLIHGQVLIGIVKFLRIENILIVSDSLQSNPTRMKLLKLTIPQDLVLTVKTVDDFVKFFKEQEISPKDNTLILFEKMDALFDFLQKSEYKGQVHFANYHNFNGNIKLTNTLTLTESELDKLRKFKAAGVDFIYCLTPYEKERKLLEKDYYGKTQPDFGVSQSSANR